MSPAIQIRHARLNDLPGLTSIRYGNQPAIHRDRIQTDDLSPMRYFIAEVEQQIIGFGLLILAHPPNWTDTLASFPMIIDLFVAEDQRSRGVGRRLIAHMEAVARQLGASTIYLSVEPDANPRALQLYTHLGYAPLQKQPYYNSWRFIDSAGVLHEGEEWLIDMRKVLD